MTSPEQKNNTPATGKSSAGKIIVLVIAIALAAYFAKSYLWKSTDGPQAQQQPQQQAPSVVLHLVEKADLASAKEYVGKVEPIQIVSLKPQVAAEITQVHFKEGSVVKAGQLLFSLDSKQFKATVDLRKADLAKAEANYSRAFKNHERLKNADKRSVSASDLDVAESEVLQAKAAIEQARAALRFAQIDLGHTRITAPISGQIGKAEFTKGNYVTPAGGHLTTIVQLDPIRVAFALPDKDYLDQMEAFRSSDGSVYSAKIRLSNGEQYPFSGERDFEDNEIDDKTGTIMMRLRFENTGGLLVPGAMVRVSTKPVQSHVSPIIPQEAVLTDSEGDYVYVVDDKNTAQVRRIKLGAEAGAMREVVSGLDAGEKIIAKGLQSVHPEITVNPAPLKNAGDGTKTPAELAMESGYDPQIIGSPDKSGDKQESVEGKN